MGDNIYWRQEVDTALLQSRRAREVVGDRQTFSLATFIDWEGMKGLGNIFNKGPNKEAFKCPIKFWNYFKIVIIEHHAIICRVNVNDGHEAAVPVAAKKRRAVQTAAAATKKQPRMDYAKEDNVVLELLPEDDAEAGVEEVGGEEVVGRLEVVGGEEVDRTTKLTKCLAKWQDKVAIYPTLTSLLDKEHDNAYVNLQVIHVKCEQGRPSGHIVITDGELYCTAKLGIPRYIQYLQQHKWGLYSVISVRETRGGLDDLVIVSYSSSHHVL